MFLPFFISCHCYSQPVCGNNFGKIVAELGAEKYILAGIPAGVQIKSVLYWKHPESCRNHKFKILAQWMAGANSLDVVPELIIVTHHNKNRLAFFQFKNLTVDLKKPTVVFFLNFLGD